MRRGLGDAIAVLDGLDLAPMAMRVKELPLMGQPIVPANPAEAYLVEPEGEFLRYMNLVELPTEQRRGVVVAGGGALFSGGSSYAPRLPLLTTGLAAFSEKTMPKHALFDPSEGGTYGGGSSYYPGAPLLSSSAGLAADMAALDGGAKHAFQAQRMSPIGSPRELLIDPSGGSTFGGGSSYYPGAPLLTSSAGLAGCSSCGVSGLGALPPRSPRGPQVKNHEIRKHFINGGAFAEYERLGGDAELKKLEKDLGVAQRARDPREAEIQRRLAVVRLFRTKVMAGGRWDKKQVQAMFLVSMRDATTTAQLSGLEGLASLNGNLAGLEGRIGRKIRQNLKKGVKLAGKGLKTTLKTAVKVGMKFGPMAMGLPPLPF
jgi:hypothetical protein